MSFGQTSAAANRVSNFASLVIVRSSHHMGVYLDRRLHWNSSNLRKSKSNRKNSYTFLKILQRRLVFRRMVYRSPLSREMLRCHHASSPRPHPRTAQFLYLARVHRLRRVLSLTNQSRTNQISVTESQVSHTLGLLSSPYTTMTPSHLLAVLSPAVTRLTRRICGN